MSIWTEYNPNPTGRKVGDCAVRAVAAALGMDWEAAYALIAANGYAMGDVPCSDAVWGSVLRQHGFYRAAIPDECPDCYTAEDFAKDHPKGVFTLCFGGHAATMKDGRLLDSWDSSMLSPQFYWYRKDD